MNNDSSVLELKTLQQQMLAWLQEADPQIRQAVSGTVKVPVQTRLDIYANAYRLRLIEALQDTFPALHTLLGDEDFFNLGIQYLTAWPSEHFSLRYFGHRMSDFLTTAEDFREQPVLAEMAQFEWLLRAAFDAADEQVLVPDILQQIDPQLWPVVQFSFHPGVKRLDLNFNTPQLWQAIDKEQPPLDVLANDYPHGWCLWRQEFRTLYRSLDVDEAWAMDAALAGENFSAICSGVCEWVDAQHAALRVAGFIQNWLADGMLVRLET